MFLRLTQLGTAMFLGVAMVAAPASAVTVPISPGGGPYIANTVDTFEANPGALTPSAGFTHDYTFTGLSSLNSKSIVTVHTSFPDPGDPGIADLFIYWLAPDNSILAQKRLTDISGTTIATKLLFAFGVINDAILRLSGTSLKTPGALYDMSVNFSSDRNTDLPLPPALLLFGSALAGLTVLGRRKRKGAAA